MNGIAKRCKMAKRLTFKSLIIQFVLFFFILAEVFSGHPIFAEVAAISGKIQKITSLDEGRFEISIKTDTGISKFVVDSSTLIQAELSVKEVKKGQSIMLLPGQKGIKSPFSKMPAATKKALGLPDMPNVAPIPKIPSLPKIPNVSQLQQTTQKPNLPKVPKLPPGMGAPPPQKSGEGASADVGVAPATTDQAKGIAPGEIGGAPSQEQAPPKEKGNENESLEAPKDPGFTALTPNALTSPTSTVSKDSAKKVVELKTTEEGISVKLEGEGGEEEVLLSPDDKVLQVLTMKDLHKNMNVNLELVQDSDQNLIQKITVT